MTTSSNPDEIRAEIERTRRELGQDVDALAEKVSPAKAVNRQTNRVKEGFVSMKENIMGAPEHHEGPGAADRASYAAHDAADQARFAAGQVQDTAHDVAGQAREYAHQAGDKASQWADDAQVAVQQAPAQIRRQTRGNPMAAGLIALGAGWLIGSLIPASEAEQRAAERVKDQAAPLVENAKQEAQQVVQQVREGVEPEVRDAAGSLKDSAAASAQSLKEEGKGKAQEIQGEAQDAAREVKDTAKKA